MGRYTDDIPQPATAYLYVLRSPHAAAIIQKIDVADARNAAGVISIFCGLDVLQDGLETCKRADPLAGSRILPILPNATEPKWIAILHGYRVGLLRLALDRFPFEKTRQLAGCSAVDDRLLGTSLVWPRSRISR
jgi:Aldehyde oxidase and xanthine dehydrogenase, a/b hammerhead domain